MTILEAMHRLPGDEFGAWFDRRARRRKRLSQAVTVLCVIVWIVSPFIFWIDTMDDLYGDDSLPSALFLSFLTLWVEKTVFQYLRQPDWPDEDDRFE